jgi:hypothetical protein
MTANPAIEWLQAHFEHVTARHAGAFGHAPAHRHWHGPSDIRPMIEFLPVMDAGPAMRVIPHDYDDPDRWPL